MNNLSEHCRDTNDESISAGMRVTWIGLFANVILVVLKLWGGLVAKSQALLADGVHSLSDLFSDFIVLTGLRWGRMQADENHPYGHGRIETIASMMVGFMLFLAGLYIGYRAISALVSHNRVVPGGMSIVIAAFSVVVKEVLYRYTLGVGKRIRSSALIGNAWHHRTDALSSIAVLIGVIAVRLNPDWYIADSVAALVVTLFIFRVAFSLSTAALHELVDRSPGSDLLEEFKEMASKVSGVLQVHDLKARRSGPVILVEMHVVVLSDISVHDGHEIAEAVKQQLMTSDDSVGEVLVHVEPESELI